MLEYFESDMINPPNYKNLDNKQQELYDHYLLEFEKLQDNEKSSIQIKNTRNSLVSFFKNLPQEKQIKHHSWYEFNLTLVDPILVGSNIMTKLAQFSGAENKIAISNDGANFLLALEEDQKYTKHFIDSIFNSLPSLKYDIIEAKYE